MAEALYLNVWFASFHEEEMLARMGCVLEQFPFSAARPGIGYVGVHSVSWNEPPVFEETFDYRAQPQHALALAAEFLHSDNGYVFEAMWELWTPAASGSTADPWRLAPQPVKFIAHGAEFEEGTCEENGHIQIELGLDSAFLLEEAPLTALGEQRIRENIEKLVGFSNTLERHCGLRGRLLWSESEDNLAQKLIARLQWVN